MRSFYESYKLNGELAGVCKRFEFDLNLSVFGIDLSLDGHMSSVVGHPDDHFALSFDKPVGAKDLRLYAHTPNFPHDRAHLFAFGDNDRNLIHQARIAHRQIKSFADREFVHSDGIDGGDHVVHRIGDLGRDAARRAITILRIRLGIGNAF